MTRIGIIGSGHIGGNLARFFASAGHDVLVSFSQDQPKLAALAADIGCRAGTPADDRVVIFYGSNDEEACGTAERLISEAGFDPVRTGTLARDDVGHQEPKGDLYGEEFHHDEAVAAVSRLRGTPPSGKGRP